MTKRALDETADGDTFALVTDSPTALANVSRYLNDNAVPFTTEEHGGEWTLTITKTTATTAGNTVAYCSTNVPHFKKGDFAVAVSSDQMGNGNPELGMLLMVNFIKAIRDLDALPASIVFYNRGVFLGIKNSPVYELLKDLGTMGINLYFCGTCLNHYRLAGKIDIGLVSNMFEIAQVMASAGKVIRP